MTIHETWVLKVKRTPDRIFKKFKSKYCIWNDLQEEDFDTFVPMVQFSSMIPFLAWSLMFGWYTFLIDSSNTLIQETLKDDTLFHLPCRFRGSDNKYDTLFHLPCKFRGSGNGRGYLKLKKSLHRILVAPKLWCQNLTFKKIGSLASKHDPYLLLRNISQSYIMLMT